MIQSVMNLETKALIFASKAHHSVGQLRKYTDDPYIVHPISVAYTVSLYSSNPNVVAATYIHDVLEDVAPTRPEFGEDVIREEFGEEVLGLVREVTNVYTIERYPSLNRATRKKAEAMRLGTISSQAMLIKLADILDNTKDIHLASGFARVYLNEARSAIKQMSLSKNWDALPPRITLDATLAVGGIP